MGWFIETTVGIQTTQVFFFMASIFAFLFFLLWRLIAIYRSHTLLTIGYRGISYMPKTSLESLEIWGLIPKHQDEFVRLLQKAPQPYLTQLVEVPCHADVLKFDIKPNGDLTVEVHLVPGSVGASCQLFVGVPFTAIETFVDTQQVDDLRRTSITYSGATLSEVAHFSLSLTELSLEYRQQVDQLSMVPLLVLVSNGTHTELTLGFTQSLAQGAPVSRTEQLVLSRGSREFIHLKGVFTGLGSNQDGDDCFVCYDQKSNTVLIPCRHSCICTRCIRQLREPKCIVCRHHFSEYLFLRRGEFSE